MLRTHALGRGALLLAPLVTMAAARGQGIVHLVDGEAAEDRFGSAVAGVGDVDGDGWPDFAVGAPGHDAAGVDAGRAQLLSGATGAVLVTIDGYFESDRFGYSVAGVGDVNGDGRGDVAVGSRGASHNGQESGSVRVHSGSDGQLLGFWPGDLQADAMGSAVGAAGDVDGDGWPDVLGGAPQYDTALANVGVVRVWSGSTGQLLREVVGEGEGEWFGSSVAGVGDLDGDGRADFVGGAPLASSGGVRAGEVRAFSGATGQELWRRAGWEQDDYFGWALAPVGDVDQDGTPDVLVGAPISSANGQWSGRVAVLSGATGAVVRDVRGQRPGDHFGWSVASAGDWDQDGRGDLLVGAYGQDGPGGINSGAAWVLSGLDGSALQVLVGEDLADTLGRAVAHVGDVDGDGRGEVLLGADFDDNSATNAGSARLVSPVDAPVGTPVCPGDGSGLLCPCFAHSTLGQGAGCVNSTGVGARLAAYGLPRLGVDTLELRVEGLPPRTPLAFLQADGPVNGASGVTAFDGVRCVGDASLRLAVRRARFGEALYPQAGEPRLGAVSGLGGAAGTRWYQVWYRDPLGACGGQSNFTGGVRVDWVP